MRRILIFIALATAVSMAAVAIFVLTSLPPKALRPKPAGERRLLAVGAYHVHSSHSDGSGSVDEIAAAAAGAGLDFVILTDHGDATSVEAPRYVNGVLVIDAVEINTDSGHVVAMNLQRPSAYPIAGEARDVIEDITRLGGWTIAAHPDSPRANLRWRGQLAGVDGVEWLNVDSEWRSRGAGTIAATALRSAVRGPEAIASLFRTPSPGLARWDLMQRGRPTVGLAAIDAHARLGADDAASSWGSAASVRFPSYATLFRTVVQVVPLTSAKSGAAAADATAILDGLRNGRSYSIVRAFADAFASLEFGAVTPLSRRVELGGHVPPGVAAALSAEIAGVPAARVDLLRDGRVIKSGHGRIEFEAPGTPAAYRVEAYVPGHPVPWLVANPIYFDRVVDAPVALHPAPVPQGLRVPVGAWHIEADASSRGDTAADANGGMAWTYRLGAGVPAGQYAALATDASGEAALDRIVITATADKPTRISLQVRVPGGRDGRRWRKSLYFDSAPRTYIVPLSDLEPVERGSALRPIVARVQSVLLVVDTVNAVPGSSGVVRISNVTLVTAPALR
jgi:hypothetical protein